MPARAPSVWPVLRIYEGECLRRVAMPIGGIGTGTVSLGGRGDLRDWELCNRPAKGFVPGDRSGAPPFFALWARAAGAPAVCRALEGPLAADLYEGASGAVAPNHGLPRFRDCTFAAAYPLAQMALSDPDVPVHVGLQAFNPLVPGDADASGIPLAVLRYELTNRTDRVVTAAVCASMPNYIGQDGSEGTCVGNRNAFVDEGDWRGVRMDAGQLDPAAPQWGTMVLATTAARRGVTARTAWLEAGRGTPLLDFWDDFSADGRLDERDVGGRDMPMASLACQVRIPPQATRTVNFLLAWHFPNRQTWHPRGRADDRIGNYYTEQYADAADVLHQVLPHLGSLEERTVDFVRSFCHSDLPAVVREAALFNLSTLRTQTCFRTPDGRLYGWEGCSERSGCCQGSCTHVWNYEQATAFLFGDLAQTMREVEFCHATRADGLMSFRVELPLSRAQEFGRAAADGQMGCVMKAFRDWQLAGDDDLLHRLWPGVKRALEFCWIEGGWDADQDGVMEGCQHNTMDVEYYGPNPQMGIWYLGALRAGAAMADGIGDAAFAARCRQLADAGSRWLDANLFNGQYYEHQVRVPDRSAEGLVVGMGAASNADPDYQLGAGCLVDQLVGQLLAHVCGLGYLVRRTHVRKTLRSILRYNRRADLSGHFNCLRSFALGDEAALLMASYPRTRPRNPFPYFTEVMTGFEYTAAIGMLYEGMTAAGLRCIGDIRARYDGRKRSPFDEAECGHHYARAMVSWAAVLALSGFRYSGVEQRMAFAARPGEHFWANGRAWGTCVVSAGRGEYQVVLAVHQGSLRLRTFGLGDGPAHPFAPALQLRAGQQAEFAFPDPTVAGSRKTRAQGGRPGQRGGQGRTAARRPGARR